MKERSQIEEKYKWDLTEYFKDEDAWKKEFEIVKKLYSKLETYEGKFGDDKMLLECLNLDKNISERVGRLYVYISLKVKEDAKNSFYQDLSNKLDKYFSDESPKVAYISSELNEIPDERLISLAKNPKFKDYNLGFKQIIRYKPHMLSKTEEKLLATVNECIGGSESVFDMIDSVDIKFEDVKDKHGNKLPLDNANYHTYIQSDDEVLRKNAFKNLNAGYGKLNYSISTNYLNSVKTDCTLAKIRNFPSAFSRSMFGEQVDESVYNSLIKNINNNREYFFRFYENKRKTLGLKVFNNYDMHAKIDVKNSNSYSYEQAFDIILNTFKIFGEEYVNVLKRARDNRWIDVMPNTGKDTGAFSWGAYGAHPVVLLNHENTIDSLFTLAHELGHMMHTYYSNSNQPSTKSSYELFVAEVASTVNEMILARTLLKNAKTKEERLYYIDYLMDMFQSTIYRQTMFAEFEYDVHKMYENGEDTTCDAINNLYFNLCKKYFGNKVNLAEELKYEWLRIPHFYNAFYVYKYATGLISALAISTKILNGEKDAVNNYLNFLKSGSTKPPVELLKGAGADLTDEKTFKNAFEFIGQVLDEWDNLMTVQENTK